jgi:hypothetical protein
MNKIIITITLLIFGAIFLKGCADLDETLRADISADEHFTTVEGLEDLSTSMYLSIRYYYAYEAGQQITICGTDEFTYGQGRRGLWNDYSAALNPFEDDPRSIKGIWEAFYEGINLANSLIERADPAEIEGLSEQLATRWIAEARFLRAHYYHLLVQHLGPVHLTLEETVGVETQASRTPEDEIWEVIIEDLEFAIANLPEVQEDFGRATANAARMNLAKVHLILENWQEAADLAIGIILGAAFTTIVNSLVNDQKLGQRKPSHVQLPLGSFTRRMPEGVDKKFLLRGSVQSDMLNINDCDIETRSADHLSQLRVEGDANPGFGLLAGAG